MQYGFFWFRLARCLTGALRGDVNEDVIVGLDFGSSAHQGRGLRTRWLLLASSSAVTPIRGTGDGDDFLVLDMLTAAADVIERLGCAPGTIKASARARWARWA